MAHLKNACDCLSSKVGRAAPRAIIAINIFIVASLTVCSRFQISINDTAYLRLSLSVVKLKIGSRTITPIPLIKQIEG